MSTPTATLRTLIVDDELHGRDVVRHMLHSHVDCTVVGEAGNGLQALEEIRTHHPDLVFLDIRMPRLDGLALLDALAGAAPPVIVFVTAHDTYAVQAFECCAFDYLLKPFDQERFDRTMARVRERVRTQQEAEFGRRLRDVLAQSASALAPGQPAPAAPTAERLTRFVVKGAGSVSFIPVERADWLEAADNYVAVHAAGRTHLIHDTLANLEQALDPRRFLRIHRSTIVNIDRIKELQPFANGEFVVILHSGVRLKLSRSFRNRANAVLGL